MEARDRPIILALVSVAAAILLARFPPTVPSLIYGWLDSDLFSALAGAFFGAYGAHSIAERARNRAELLNEMRSTNAAITIASTICNTGLGLKKAHIKSLKETFDRESKRHSDALEAVAKSRSQFDYVFEADYRMIYPIPDETGELRSLIFQKVSAGSRAIVVLTTLAASVSNLNGVLSERNRFIEEFRSSGGQSDSKKAATYFGFSLDGVTDERNASFVNAAYAYTDDCIFFGRLLVDELVAHALRLRERWRKDYRDAAPEMNRGDFSIAEQLGLFPDRKNYEEWLSAFNNEF